MKRLLMIFCVMLLLVSAAAPGLLHGEAEQAEETEFRFTRENFPTLDGSTSMVPLGQGIASVLLGESREDVDSLISFNRTTQSFRNLARGNCSVVIAAEPKSSVFDEMDEVFFEYDIETIAKEALVFVVNENNPVDSLTREQVRDIYTGKITNWKEVGGEDMPIEAFQRNPTAGSQVMMEKLVMDGTPMMEAPTSQVPSEMGELIEAVKSFDNSSSAIGYTVYYYAADMQMAQGLKILRIDGVLPDVETIRSEEYPFINGYYACISANAEYGVPARTLFDWLVSEEGQALLTLEGYVSVYAPGEAPWDGKNVYTNYDQYVPHSGMEAMFTPIDGDLTRLVPSDDYGLIYPYQGSMVFSTWAEEEYDYYSGNTYGFFNAQGQLITNPVYSNIFRIAFEDSESMDYVWGICNSEGRYAFAAPDGSFFSDFVYDYMYSMGEFLRCNRDENSTEFDLFTKDGKLVKTQEDFTFDGVTYSPYDCRNGLFLCAYYPWDDPYGSDPIYRLVDGQGNVLLESAQYLYMLKNGGFVLYNVDDSCSVFDADLKPVFFDGHLNIDSYYYLTESFRNVALLDGSRIITDDRGTLFDWDVESAKVNNDDTFSVRRNGEYRLYDSRGHLLYFGQIPEEWEYIGARTIFSDESQEDVLILHDVETDRELQIPNGLYAYSVANVLGVYCYDEEHKSHDVLVNPDLTILNNGFKNYDWLMDICTEESWLREVNSYGFSGEQRLMTSDGSQEILRANGSLQIMNRIVTVSNDYGFQAYDMDGNLFFCYPYYGLGNGD